MEDCVFCKVVRKEIPSHIEKETDNFLVFKDINPKAPIHLLITLKKHIGDIRGLEHSLWVEISEIAKQLALEKKLMGFRLTHNAGNAAQAPHMHVHFLGGVTAEREV